MFIIESLLFIIETQIETSFYISIIMFCAQIYNKEKRMGLYCIYEPYNFVVCIFVLISVFIYLFTFALLTIALFLFLVDGSCTPILWYNFLDY